MKKRTGGPSQHEHSHADFYDNEPPERDLSHEMHHVETNAAMHYTCRVKS